MPLSPTSPATLCNPVFLVGGCVPLLTKIPVGSLKFGSRTLGSRSDPSQKGISHEDLRQKV